jgi:phosphotransacetylase
VPALSLKWEKQIIEEKNKKDRQKVVEGLLNRMKKEGVRVESQRIQR